MTKEELAHKIVELSKLPGMMATSLPGIFTFIYGHEAVDKFSPVELMKLAHQIDPLVKDRYCAELNGAFGIYRFFQHHPDLFDMAKAGINLSGVPVARCELLGPLQQIFYGAPGTGKSWKVDEIVKNPAIKAYRTTFHPDSDYSTFVGAYKPTMKTEQRVVYINDGKTAQLVENGPDTLKYEKKISYEFRPQAFMNAYVAAWKNPDKPVVLVVEEINRGNCAQIFGDLFQLLDRNDENGYSAYPIDADTDLAKWLSSDEEDEAGQLLRFGKDGLGLSKPDDLNMRDDDWADVMKGKKLALPPNLYIWATMNTSDQSLFPIDSAFKRRWDWKYVPIKDEGKGWKIAVGGRKYDWWQFLTVINAKIGTETGSEDKKLGYFFVKATDNGEISAEKFVNKVAFYLWSDVFNITGTDGKEFRYTDDKGEHELKFHSFFKESDGSLDEGIVCQFLDNFNVPYEGVLSAVTDSGAESQ